MIHFSNIFHTVKDSSCCLSFEICHQKCQARWSHMSPGYLQELRRYFGQNILFANGNCKGISFLIFCNYNLHIQGHSFDRVQFMCMFSLPRNGIMLQHL